MGVLYIVATPIGNLNDFSKRAVDTLTNCDLILAEDTRQTLKLLSHFNIKNKLMAYHKFNEMKKVDEIVKYLKGDSNIALVSDAGTPCISDPGYILVKRAREENIKVLSVPGCSAVISALSISGLDTSSFSFYGFVPNDNKERKKLFEEINYSKIKTKVLYESPKRIIKLLEDLKNYFPNSYISVCSELTKIHEKTVYGKVEEVYESFLNDENANKGEYVILISNYVKEKEDNNLSIESLLVDEIIKNKVSLKEAIASVNKKYENISKRDIYNASLNLKEYLR